METALREALDALPEIDGDSLTALALERMPLAASIVEAVREDDRIVDFCVRYANAAASASVGATERAASYGQPLSEIIPGFAEHGLRDRFTEAVEQQSSVTVEAIPLSGEFEGARFDLVFDIVAVSLGGDFVLTVSHDRTQAHLLGDKLAAAHDKLRRRRELDRQLQAINTGLIDDLVNVQRALDANDVRTAAEHADRGAARAADVVLGLRSLVLRPE